MLQAKDIMTSPVISVRPDMTIGTVAETLLTHGISAAPVIEDDRLAGIVSESDLLRREEIDTLPDRRSWLLRLFTDDAALAREYIRTHSSHVADVMTRDVVAIGEDTPAREIADILERRHIKRVPVLRDGKVTGIVSRANLLRSLAVALRGALQPVSRADAEVRADVLDSLRAQNWSSSAGLGASVAEGVVTLWGTCRSDDERRASRVLVENIPGVRSIDDRRALIDLAYDITYGPV